MCPNDRGRTESGIGRILPGGCTLLLHDHDAPSLSTFSALANLHSANTPTTSTREDMNLLAGNVKLARTWRPRSSRFTWRMQRGSGGRHLPPANLNEGQPMSMAPLAQHLGSTLYRSEGTPGSASKNAPVSSNSRATGMSRATRLRAPQVPQYACAHVHHASVLQLRRCSPMLLAQHISMAYRRTGRPSARPRRGTQQAVHGSS